MTQTQANKRGAGAGVKSLTATPLRIAMTAVCAIALSGVLSGCSLFGNSDDKPPLEGERISVLQLQKEMQPDPVLQASGMQLPDSWNNQFWPQAGGYPSHAMGHLALGQDLERLWSVDIGSGGEGDLPLITQPIIADGRVFAMDTDARLTAYGVENGKKQWSRKLANEDDGETASLGGGIAFAGGKVFATTGYRDIIVMKPDTGEEIWRKRTPAPTRSAPAVLGGRVYIVTIDNRLICYDEDDGSVLWTYTGVAETTNLLGSTSPALDRSLVVTAFSSGEIAAFRAENGQTLWVDNLASIRRGGGALGSISDIKGLPIIDQGIVYAISFNGRIVAIDERTGGRIWQREIGGAQTPWTAGDSVFVITASQQLVALSRQTGGIYWTAQLPEFAKPAKRKGAIVWHGPVMAGGRLIAASNHGEVIEIDPQTGNEMNRFKTKGKISIPPVVADGVLYLLSQSGDLTAYKGK